MSRFVLSRLAWAIPTILVIVVLSFLVVHIVPGDPIQALIGDYPAPPEYAAQIRATFGLDQPLPTQLWLYFVNLAHGNLGFSFASREDVLHLVLSRAPLTLLLTLPALTLSAIFGVTLALIAAPRVGSAVDNGITTLTLIGASVPVFWLGQMLVVIFAIRLGWLPAQGMMSLRTPPSGLRVFTDLLAHLALPVTCLTLLYTTLVARVARASVLDALSQDFVLTAKAKGVTRREILWKHVLPNSAVPIITVIGYNFGHCLTGAILVEAVFAWPGLGSAFIASIQNRDYSVSQGIFLFVALTVVLANVVTDVLTALVDPRVRKSYDFHG
ncbi:MAG TPA: ABC transporter permease [Devosiaceae bacterium]|jgi:peptide/nickel transport system permease protein